MKSIFGFTLMLSISLVLNACHKNRERIPSLPPGKDTYFLISKDGNTLSDSILSKIKLFYYTSSGTYVDDPGYDDTSFVYLAKEYFPADIDFHDTKIMFFRYLTPICVNEDIHDFYLKFPDGDVDTLWIDAEHVSNEDGQDELCYCQYPLRKLLFNGKPVREDTSVHLSSQQPVYLFEK